LSVEKAKLNDVNNKQYISTRQKKGLYYGEIKISSCFHLPTMRDKHIPVWYVCASIVVTLCTTYVQNSHRIWLVHPLWLQLRSATPVRCRSMEGRKRHDHIFLHAVAAFLHSAYISIPLEVLMGRWQWRWTYCYLPCYS
jgi:hypothetical protein